MLIITLSAIPPRFPKMRPTLDSLLAQTVKPDRIIIYIPKAYGRFPDWDGSLPEVPEGVELHRTDEDLGPATKLVPALAEFRGQDVDIIFCDDDVIYPKGWAARFLATKKQKPGHALTVIGSEARDDIKATMKRDLKPRALLLWYRIDPAFQARKLRRWIIETATGARLPKPTRRPFLRSGYVDIIGGAGGVMVRPEYFDDDVFNIPQELRAVDDVWFSGILAKNKVPIWLDAGHGRNITTDAETEHALSRAVINGDTRRQANARCITYMRETYGIWP